MTEVQNRREVTVKTFLTNPDYLDVNLFGAGKGARLIVGRVTGLALSADVKPVGLPDGSTMDSIVLKGFFSTDRLADGEKSETRNLSLPNAFAKAISSKLEGSKEVPGVKAVAIDAEIFVEATGTGKGYTWGVTSYLADDKADVVSLIGSDREVSTILLLDAKGNERKPKEAEKKDLPSA